MRAYIVLALAAALGCNTLQAQVGRPKALGFPLDSTAGLKLVGVNAEPVTYKGRKALRVVEAPDTGSGPAVAIMAGTESFQDGEIELDVIGKPAPGANLDARGFVGLVFRTAPDAARFENFYLRPTNGRAEEQLRRNHSTQYTSHPDFPWHRLRKENPGVYESYVDLEPDTWTHMRIVVEGVRAKLYVNNAPQPCLIVNDLKLGSTQGLVGLWIGAGTEAYFSRLMVRPRQ